MQSIFYKFVLTLLFIAAAYSIFGIVNFKYMRYNVQNTDAEFLVSGDTSASITFVEYLNYACMYCRKLHPTIEELQTVRKDVRYIIKPVAFSDDETEKPTRMAIAAGLQGKFQEMHKAFLEYPEDVIPDDFIEETAALYGLDYDQLIKDSTSKKVAKIIESNMNSMQHAGIRSVPSFFVNDKIYIVTEEGLPTLKQLLNITPTKPN